MLAIVSAILLGVVGLVIVYMRSSTPDSDSEATLDEPVEKTTKQTSNLFLAYVIDSGDCTLFCHREIVFIN